LSEARASSSLKDAEDNDADGLYELDPETMEASFEDPTLPGSSTRPATKRRSSCAALEDNLDPTLFPTCEIKVPGPSSRTTTNRRSSRAAHDEDEFIPETDDEIPPTRRRRTRRTAVADDSE
jgi:hypothetical protein